MAKYTKKFMDTLIELIFGLVLLPVAASLIATTLANEDLQNDSNYAVISIIIGIILIFVALGLVYHVIKQLF
jgi:uncharacterized membrane protein